MKSIIFLSLALFFSASIYATDVATPPTRDVNPLPPGDCSIWDSPACTINETDSCITDIVTVASSPEADLLPGGPILNSFEFTRINEKMIHAKAAQYYFPNYEDRIQVILENTGNFNGLTRYQDIKHGLIYLFDCDKGFIYTIGAGASVERLEIQ